MNIWRQIAESFAAFMDGVATSVLRLRDRIAAPASVKLIERANGHFAIEQGAAGEMEVVVADGIAACSPAAANALKGKSVEISLLPSRFFFRPLELPRRAAEFLKGVVQAQIDRITPWTANEAVFGWGTPTDVAADRISVTVAAAARAQVVPIAEAIASLGPKSVGVSTTLPDHTPINLFDQSSAAALGLAGVRRAVTLGFAGMLLLAVLAVTADLVIGGNLKAQQAEVSQQIAERRGLLRAGSDALTNSALARLERRKQENPADVIVLEALSKVLPDATYVTELRIEGDKVQIVGITNDAPSLIRLIEQSPHFSRATFFAPTTRSPGDPGDRFHIEAQIKPVFTPPS